jgi:hypothetical protein
LECDARGGHGRGCAGARAMRVVRVNGAMRVVWVNGAMRAGLCHEVLGLGLVP